MLPFIISTTCKNDIYVIDEAIGRILESCEKHGYTLMLTSDHGNAEQMFSPQGGPHTAHTCNRGKLDKKLFPKFIQWN